MAGRCDNLSGAGVAIQPEQIDEMKCHPNHVNDMRKIYQCILAELADSNVGECIIRELRNDPTYTLCKYSYDLGDEIMKGEYFLS